MSESAQMTLFERWGCPLDDSTNWDQSESGEVFTSPEGIATVVSSLPCFTRRVQLLLPGTCADCELYQAGMTEIGQYPTNGGLDR